MARNMRAALTQRDELVHPFRERCDRLRDELRMPPAKLLQVAEQLVRASCQADHEYDERVGDSLEEYRRLTMSEDASRY